MRNLFEIPDDVAYFNCAYLGPQLKAVTQAGAEALRRKVTPWTFDAKLLFTETERLRATMARIMKTETDAIALVPSASYGIQVAANNLPVAEGQHILVLEEEFPSNVFPWRALAAKAGATVKTVARTERMEDSVTEQTAIVAAPHCHWTDGTAVDLEEVGRRARKVGAALVVDASQSLGAWDLNLEAIRPDFVVSVGYKWLLGPMGLGYLYAAPAYRGKDPIEYNWVTRAGAEDFSRLVHYRDDYEPGARRFDFGERHNLLSVPMAIAALEQIEKWGVSTISAEIGKKTARIEEETRRRGLNPVPREARGPHLMGVRLPAGASGALVEKLNREKVYVSLRGDSVRISPHLYNTDADIDRLCAALVS